MKTATSTEYTFSTAVRASLSRREHVAAMALQGLLANPRVLASLDEEVTAGMAIHQADVLLRLLDADPEPPATLSGAEGEGGAAR